MKKYLGTMKFLPFLIIFMCCGMLTNAQSKESSVNTTTNFSHPRPTKVIHGIKSSKTALLSQMVFSTQRTTIASQSSRLKVSATRTIVTSSMTTNMTTPIGPSQGPMTSDSTNLGLIVGIAVGVAALLAVACLVLCLVRTRLSCGRKCKGRRTGALPPVTYNKPNEEGLSEETGKDHVVRVDRLRSLKSSQPRSVRADFETMKMPSDDMAFSNDMTIEDEEEVESRVKKAKERRSKTLSVRPGLVKKLITTEGGVTKIADISLDVGPGCLENDTEITLIRDDQNFAFQSLLKLGLVDDTPRVVEFLPDGLKFLKPALLKIKCEKSDPESELFVLHGSYNPDYQRTVWELVTNDLEENSIDGVVSMKINGFCFYSYILARRGKIARILSHLNHSFSCRAYSFYRRASVDSMDISVVIVSEFVDKKAQERIDQLQTHQEEGYTKGEKGKLKRVHTDRRLEMSLNFPDLISSPFPFKIDQPQLDSVGFVVEKFKVTPITSPANGTVDIKELHRSAANKLLWNLNIREMEKEIKKEAEVLLHNSPEPGPPQVVYRDTVLTNAEISRMSNEIGMDWDALAALMNIPYGKRDEIRMNASQYPDNTAKGQQILAFINESQNFDRHTLEKCVKELGRGDVKIEIHPEDECQDETIDGTEPPQPPCEFPPYENITLKNTPLSPREMYRLSRRILLFWARFACLMDVDKPEIDNIQTNNFYNDDRSRAEKVLSIINNKHDFSRTKLTDCLKDLDKLDLVEPLTNGAWRQL